MAVVMGSALSEGCPIREESSGVCCEDKRRGEEDERRMREKFVAGFVR